MNNSVDSIGKKNGPRRIPGVGPILLTWGAVLAGSLFIAGCSTPQPPPPKTFNAELAYLKQVNFSGAAKNPAMIFLLMGEFLGSNQTGEGISFFEEFLRAHGSSLSGPQRSLYLSALALLRANHASYIPLLDRIDWVEKTIAMLEEAQQLSGETIFVVQWIAGVVYARLPNRFGTAERAREALTWAAENADRAPDEGWLREVYYNLALLNRERGDPVKTKALLAKGGFDGFNKPMTLLTPYSVGRSRGFAFGPPRLKEIVPGRVFALSGFEFTDFHFIVSRDRKQLIAIDAGTRDDSVEAAYTALKRRVPDLPPLTTVIITHAHWDHVGGNRFFRRLNPKVRFYASAKYQEEIRRLKAGSALGYSYFFGSRFEAGAVLAFKPDVEVRRETELRIGGTRLTLIPVDGGETPDGLFIHLPEEKLLFVGDFAMPYFGAPTIEEGSLPGLFKAIDKVGALAPKRILHGHTALTRLFPNPRVLGELKRVLSWLETEVRGQIRLGKNRSAVHRSNLIPPFIQQVPSVQVSYLVARENLINRVFDQTVGYWKPGLQGMDILGPVEANQALARYLDLSGNEIANAVENMIEAGDFALAARTLRWAAPLFPASPKLSRLKRGAYLGLIGKYQTIDPFKFILYAERIGLEIRPLNAGPPGLTVKPVKTARSP